MNIMPIFMIGEMSPQAMLLKEELIRMNYVIINSSIGDEIDQAGKQAKKIILIFSDFKFAVNYLQKESKAWGGFDMLRVLFLPAEPKISPEIEKILYSVNLNIFHAKKTNSLIERITSFKEENSYNPDDKQDIELDFTVLMEKEK
jgi:hypothetical protein